jgi:glycosyltransferase involved in cell wall biosynthesis
MKIALLGTTAQVSLNFRKPVIEKLSRDGHQVYLLCNDYNQETREQAKKLGAEPIDSPLSRSSLNPLTAIIETHNLYKIFKKIKPDIVFSFFSKPSIFGTLAAKYAKIPKIIAMLEGLGYYFTQRKNKPSRKDQFIKFVQITLYRLSFKSLDLLILLNADDYTDIIDQHKIKPKKTTVLSGIGVDFAHFFYTPITHNHVNFLFVGRLLHDKGIREFVEAAKNIKKQYPKTIFTVVGDIDPQNPASLSLKEKKELEDDEVIHFKGFTNNVKQSLIDASIFVLPSYREGLPLSTQEAMAIGRGVITTTVPGCSATVQEGKTGFTIPPFNAKALEKKMQYFIMNKHKIKELGYNAHIFAQKQFNAAQQSATLCTWITE